MEKNTAQNENIAVCVKQKYYIIENRIKNNL